MRPNQREAPAPYERDHRRVAIAFAGVLKLARNGAGLSQEELAEAADIDRTYPRVAATDIGRTDCCCLRAGD